MHHHLVFLVFRKEIKILRFNIYLWHKHKTTTNIGHVMYGIAIV
jgi:hypothetical protein